MFSAKNICIENVYKMLLKHYSEMFTWKQLVSQEIGFK